jgi:hypothetical protein
MQFYLVRERRKMQFSKRRSEEGERMDKESPTGLLLIERGSVFSVYSGRDCQASRFINCFVLVRMAVMST